MTATRQFPYMELPDEDEVWGIGNIRLFISHKAEDKELATQIKSALNRCGITSFVAHEDITPTEEWQNSILTALSSMDVLVVLLTERVYPSDWIDQEIGYAIGQDVPIVPIRLGTDPRGFLGKYQALNGLQGGRRKLYFEIADDLFDLMITRRRLGLQEKASEGLIKAIESAGSFRRANHLSELLREIDSLTPDQIDALIEAYHTNDQVFYAFEFVEHIVEHLNRLSPLGEIYEYGDDRKIVTVSPTNQDVTCEEDSPTQSD